MKTFAAIIAAASALALLAGCKGRTTDTVEPSGDTVELTVIRDSVTQVERDTVTKVIVDTAGGNAVSTDSASAHNQ